MELESLKSVVPAYAGLYRNVEDMASQSRCSPRIRGVVSYGADRIDELLA